ncbi:MAG: peptidase MA family metallohydrolase [Candidatus Omnitrophica bacterium]|nr:peptidase MA family metallohydrolase [Candidatus Omnitrophota bacterium]
MTIIFLISYSTCQAEIKTSFWETKKSEHFVLYFQNASLTYVNEILDHAENYYKNIAEELGFIRYSKFWTWDSRAKIYLYKDKETYQNETNYPEWSTGGVHATKREIYSYMNMQDFLDTILPHELGHIIFREFVGYKKKIPLWLDEGVACFLEKKNRPDRLLVAKWLINKTGFLPLEDLGKMSRGGVLMPDIFYAESTSIIDFLIKVYGKDKFGDCCRALRELGINQDWFSAFKKTYGFKSLEEFNSTWKDYLSATLWH